MTKEREDTRLGGVAPDSLFPVVPIDIVVPPSSVRATDQDIVSADRYVVDSVEACREASANFVPSLSRRGHIPQVTEAVGEYTGELFQVDTVDGVVFLTGDNRRAPTTLNVRVLGRFGQDTPEAANNFRAVATATAALSERLDAVGMPTGLRFINIPDGAVLGREAQLREYWGQDTSQQLRAFIAFQRS
ncbi:MAG: hypothetical protein HY428_00520 [Candidatus Levybacteria bacterium]|nr:hypothetical protein [Candidatus Levybacteria bacterium]